MADIHIDDFYRDTAKALVALYNHFPRKMILYVEDIAGPDTPDEFGLHSQRHEACLHTLLWLASVGYLKYDDIIKQEALDQAVLTQKAFLLLNHYHSTDSIDTASNDDLPEEVIHREFLVINTLRQELKTGTSFTINKCVNNIMRMAKSFE